MHQRLNKNDCIINTNRQHHYKQSFDLMKSNEDAIQLKGLVAKTRALFENNSNNQISEQTPTITRPNYVLSSRVQKQFTTLVSLTENDSDKENSANKMAPFLNQLKPTSKLATKFKIFNNNNNDNEKNAKLILPAINNNNNNKKWMSNQQQYTPPMYSSSSASSSPPPSSLSSHSFDSSNEIRHDSTSPSLWQPSEETSKELNLPTSVRQAKLCFERNIQKQSNDNVKQIQKIKTIESPIFSSSSSMSSVPSSPTSSVDINCRFKTVNKQAEEKYVYPHNYTVTPTTNNNNKIKILKKNFQNKCNKQEQQEQKQQLPFNLYQNQRENLTSVKVQTEDTMSENNSIKQQLNNVSKISNASIQIKTIKLRQQEPVVSIKSILRNKTPVLDESQISPKLNRKHVLDFLEKEQILKVDQSSCVLPSKLKTNHFESCVNNEIKQPIAIKPINSCFKTWQQQPTNLGLNKPQFNLATNNNNNNNNMAKRISKNAASAKENLKNWCRKHTQSYYNVSIDNFSSSWSNGLAFCALIDHFLPGSFDYNQLDPINARRNFELAFKTAE